MICLTLLRSKFIEKEKVEATPTVGLIYCTGKNFEVLQVLKNCNHWTWPSFAPNEG
jgi:hypothetical protein